MSRAVYGGLLINLPKGSPMSTVPPIDSRNERSIAVTRRLGTERAETFTTERSRQVVQCFRPALSA
ncbi:hypothetical protein ACWEQP_23350 [Streptomyces sp. NPDC004044]